MLITLALSPFEVQTLTEFRQMHAEYQRTTSSTPEPEPARRYSAVSTAAQILAEALDAARAQGM
ncbi:hypothetical protein LVW35_27885 [Pseudomonas sp. HN11]|uniref:hypothetical protein n=1 Tax=Pseudomonas sp. HN11 TaxID=1344094 RepID=UPI001F4290BA|nr:hypothetical protein [Pseudomonas sp. HN11]UII71404.1 hypothetical protein LVW35_27885 [Pseudomonas sp. HN11]